MGTSTPRPRSAAAMASMREKALPQSARGTSTLPPLAHASHAAAQAVRSASAGGELRRKPPRRSRSAAHKEGAGRIGRQALTASHAEASAGELACAGSWRMASDSWAPPPPPLKSSGGGAHALASTMHSPGKGWGQGQG